MQSIIEQFQTWSAFCKFSAVMESSTAKEEDGLTPFLILDVLEAKIFQYNVLEGYIVWGNVRYSSSTFLLPFVKACGFLCNGSWMTFSLVCSFNINEFHTLRCWLDKQYLFTAKLCRFRLATFRISMVHNIKQESHMISYLFQNFIRRGQQEFCVTCISLIWVKRIV